MNSIVQKFIEEYPREPYNSYKAVNSDCKALDSYLRFSSKPLDVLSEQNEAQLYVDYLLKRFSPKTVKRRICTLRKLLLWGKENRFITYTDLYIKDKIVIPQTKAAAGKEDISRLYRYCKNISPNDDYITARSKMECLLIVLYGFKISELTELTLNDFERGFDGRANLANYAEVNGAFDVYIKLRSDFASDKNVKCDLLFITLRGSVKTRINHDFNTVRRDCGLSDELTVEAVRGSCMKFYRESISDDVITARIFNVTQSWIKSLSWVEKNSPTGN